MSDMSYPTKKNTKFMIVQGGEKKVMKKILSVALSTAMAFSMFASVAFGETATTPEAQFNALAAKGILNGYPDGQAHLEKDLTRAEFAKIIAKLFDLSEVTNKLSYKDKNYNANHLARGYIEAVTLAGLMNGRTATTFDPSGKVTVQEVATVLARALKLGTPTTVNNSATAWAKNYVQAVIDKGLISKDANFQGNANRALVVSAAYAVQVLRSAPALKTVVALDANTLAVTFENGTTAEVKLTTALVADTATPVTFTVNGFTYTTTVTLAKAQVTSVTVLNAKQIQVVFNRKVDSTTATTVSKYTYQTNTLTAAQAIPAGSDLSVGSDGRTVTITTPTSLNNSFGAITAGTPFKFLVSGVKDSTGTAFADYSTTLTSNDTVAPVLTGASATAKTNTTKVTLTFSEPVDVAGAIVYVGGVSAVVTGGTTNTVTLTTAQTLDTGKTYEISALNFKDFAGNFLSPNPTALSVTVSSDVVAPVVQSAVVVRDNAIDVTFDKAMDANYFAGNIRLLDANGIAQGSTPSTSLSSSGKVLHITFPVAVPFNSAGTFTGTLILADGMRDTLGNTKSTTSHAITFVKDVVAPIAQSATYTTSKTGYATGLIVVKMSEEVAIASASLSNYSLITSGGTVLTSPFSTLAIGSDASEVYLGTSAILGAGTYTLRVNGSSVQDLSTQSNKNSAAVITLTVGAASDSTKPVVYDASVTPTPATSATTGTKIAVHMTDAVGLDLASVQSPTNYLLNGVALPSGSYITVTHIGASTESSPTDITATINIPAGSIKTSANYTLNVTNVKDKAGNVADPKAATVAALVDDVAPVLNAATISSNGLLVLGFTENVNAVVTTSTYDDFEFVVNSVSVTGANLANIATFSAGTGTDAGKYVVTFKAVVDSGADANAATTTDNRLFLDVNGNSTYEQGVDILIQTGTTTTVGPVAAFDVNKLSSLVVKVSATANAVTDTSTLANPIVTGTSVTVK